MSKENRAAVLALISNYFETTLKQPLETESFIYMKGSFPKNKHDDDCSYEVQYEANNSYMVGLNTLYYDSLIDLSDDKVYLVDILNKYKNNIWVQSIQKEKMHEFGIEDVISQEDLGPFLKQKKVARIFINRGVNVNENRFSNHWVPPQLKEFQSVLDFDTLYPLLNLARTIKNPTEIKLMKEVSRILFKIIF